MSSGLPEGAIPTLPLIIGCASAGVQLKVCFGLQLTMLRAGIAMSCWGCGSLRKNRPIPDSRPHIGARMRKHRHLYAALWAGAS